MGLAAGMREGDIVLDVGCSGPAVARRFNPVLRQAARVPLRWLDGLDDVMASARKP